MLGFGRRGGEGRGGEGRGGEGRGGEGRGGEGRGGEGRGGKGRGGEGRGGEERGGEERNISRFVCADSTSVVCEFSMEMRRCLTSVLKTSNTDGPASGVQPHSHTEEITSFPY